MSSAECLGVQSKRDDLFSLLLLSPALFFLGAWMVTGEPEDGLMDRTGKLVVPILMKPAYAVPNEGLLVGCRKLAGLASEWVPGSYEVG